MISNKILVLGIDLGTSGVRVAVITKDKKLIHSESIEYSKEMVNCDDWRKSCQTLISKIPLTIKKKLKACSVDGTSGTLVACNIQGEPLGPALPYFNECIESSGEVKKIFNDKKEASSSFSSLSRAIELTKVYGENILLRHQADWITGWLLNSWKLGEAGNNLKLGWESSKSSWPQQIKMLSWFKAFPNIVKSGDVMGVIDPKRAKELELPNNLVIIAGTTDSNAAVIATDALVSDGITVLGSTLVIKRFSKYPIKGAGITNHLIGSNWLAGGASNAGCAVLKKFFDEKDLVELSRQINPERNSGLNYRPLMNKGERFPTYNPELDPILEPRPISDSLFLHGLLEGLAKIEAQGWVNLQSKGLKPPEKIITIGGGAANPQWRRIRERIIGVPIRTCSKQTAEGVARIALMAISKMMP